MFQAADLLRRNGELVVFSTLGFTRETRYSGQVKGSILTANNQTAVCVRVFEKEFDIGKRIQTLSSCASKCDAVAEFIEYECRDNWVLQHFQSSVIITSMPQRWLSPTIARGVEIVDILFAATRMIECNLVSGSLDLNSFAYVADAGDHCAWKIVTPEQVTRLSDHHFYTGRYTPPSLRGITSAISEDERIYATLFGILHIVFVLLNPTINTEIIHSDEKLFSLMYKTSYQLHPHVFPAYVDLLANAEHLRHRIKMAYTRSLVRR